MSEVAGESVATEECDNTREELLIGKFVLFEEAFDK